MGPKQPHYTANNSAWRVEISRISLVLEAMWTVTRSNGQPKSCVDTAKPESDDG
jgi:hypothetical protein